MLLQQIPHPLQRTLLHITGVSVRHVGNGARGGHGLGIESNKDGECWERFLCSWEAALPSSSDTADKGSLGGGICTFLAWLQGQWARAVRPADSVQVQTRHTVLRDPTYLNILLNFSKK